MSWNVWRAGRDKTPQVLQQIQSHGQNATVVGLQECLHLNQSILMQEGWRLVRSKDKLAGFMFRSSLPIRYTSTAHNRLVVIIVGNVILVSAYFPHEGRKNVVSEYSELCDLVEKEVQAARTCFEKEGGKDFEVALLADANVELPAEVQGEGGRRITGGGLRGDLEVAQCTGGFETKRSRRKKFMRLFLQELIVKLDLVASNTFEDRAPTHFTRALKIPQVLDYIFAPAWWGHSRVAWQDQRHTGNESSDHAAIFLDLPCTIRPGRPARPKRPVHKDWDFESDTAKRYFAALAFESLVTSHPDEEFAPSDRIAEVLSSSAKNIPTKSVHRSLPQKSEKHKALERARRSKQWEDEEGRRRLNQQLRKERNTFKSLLIQYMSQSRKTKKNTPVTKLLIGGRMEEDQDRWRASLLEHAREKFSNEEVRRETEEAMRELKDQAFADGNRLEFLFSDLLTARSRMTVGKQMGEDGITVSMIRGLGFGGLQEIHKTFLAIYEGKEITPDDWRKLTVTFIPKSENTKELADTRALAVSSCLTKWYSLSLVVILERFLTSSLDPDVNIFGFMPGRRTTEITAATKHLCKHASIWGKGQTLWLCSCDILKAYDHLRLTTCLKAMKELGVPPSLRYAILEPMLRNKATATFQNTQCEEVPWDTCVRTGGVESPILFVLVTIAMIAPTVRSWRDRGLG